MQRAADDMRGAIGRGGGVLFVGERGTEGERFARVIHRASFGTAEGGIEQILADELHEAKTATRFIVVDCARAADVEHQLFGAVPGTPRAGAGNGHGEAPAGREAITVDAALAQASGGTLLLQHVTEMPRRAQVRLARVLCDGEVWVHTYGYHAVMQPVAVRLMATAEAVDGDPMELALETELLNRLTSTVVYLPALRDRRADFPALVAHLLVGVCRKLDLPVKTASESAVELLSALPWRGNVTELRALLLGLTIHARGPQIRLRDVLTHVRLDGRAGAALFTGTLREARERFEREYVAHVLRQHHGRMGDAARALGVQRTNLYRKIRHLEVTRKPARRGREAGDA